MRVRSMGRRRAMAAAGALAVSAMVAVGVAASGASASGGIDEPLATGLANPGVIHADGKWVMLTTGAWNTGGHIATATETKGPWHKSATHLLTRRPAWMSTAKSVWAPSIVRATRGEFVVYYAGVVKGEKYGRCIGTAHGAKPTGPFVPYDRPLACWAGTRPYDRIAKEGRNFSLIDPTPASVGGQLVLTYKTQYRRSSSAPWHTTQRMVRLNPTHPERTMPNPVHASGYSIKLADSRNTYIEENPVLVEHNGTYTLFTSFGWYGTCDYHTRYRQNSSLWRGWLTKSPSGLPFAASVDTCGTGNAQVVRGLPAGSWRIFFNGHPDRATAGGPDGLYVGLVSWRSGKPRVTGLLH